MKFIETIYQKAKSGCKRVAIPECTNPSMMRACCRAVKDQMAEVIFIGDVDAIRTAADKNKIDISGIKIVDIADETYKNELIERYVALPGMPMGRKSITRRINKPLYMALVMEAVGDVDCTFGGLDTTTYDFIIAATGVIGLAEGALVASALMMLEIEGFTGVQGNVIGMSDGAINTEPESNQLASIGISCCETFRKLMGQEAKCAYLSYSTDGSGSSPSVYKVQEAVRLAKEQRPDLKIDGEFQADAALLQRVASKKIKRDSDVAGQANVLIFPDAAGCNIGSKLVQLFADCTTYGPIYQGFKLPVLDCSRGDTEERIYDNIALCSVLAADF